MMRRFRKANLRAPLSHDAQVRQGRIVGTAQAAFGDIDAVRGFLNTHHDGLRGRPLDLAVQSQAGLSAVEALIAARSPSHAGNG